VRAIGTASQQTSTGTANVKTFSPPAGATGMLISVETNPCRISLDGTAPGATSVLLPVSGTTYIPAPGSGGRGQSVQVASNVAGNSVVTVQFLQ
jgi:hypothetical protein